MHNSIRLIFGQFTLIYMVGILCLSFIAPENIYAKKKRRKYYKTDILVADRVQPTFETAMIDSLIAELDETMFPSNELYEDQWNTEYVKAYDSVQIPDSFALDVSSFIMPVQNTHVTSNYGPRRRRFHYGTDLKLQVGDTVVAAFDGKVRVKKYQRGGYGYYLVLRHPNGLETVYGHLSGFLVYQDQYVKAGEPIALGGNTGRSTGPHLHFEFRFLGNPINPGEIIDLQELALKDDSYLFLKSESSKSYASSNKNNRYTATTGDKQIKYHRVKEGDTLGAIARRYGISVSALCRLNNIKSSTVLRAGRSIRVS
ncbi:MAG: peptidoglycan DD-metalloendopeptidase family protein [Dysgonamonadaceae bacterium]|nr:peptidoglycan DD-metalloendopeptidase family protein [Dysgonamonadaceae bacterium]